MAVASLSTVVHQVVLNFQMCCFCLTIFMIAGSQANRESNYEQGTGGHGSEWPFSALQMSAICCLQHDELLNKLPCSISHALCTAC